MMVRKESFTSNRDYNQYISTLSLNGVNKMRRERDLEVFELHNRIKKLMIEEERSCKKMTDARKKAMALLDSH